MKANEVLKTLNIERMALSYLVKIGLIKFEKSLTGRYDYNDKSVNLLKKIQNLNSKHLTK